jgi:cell division protein FtsL
MRLLNLIVIVALVVAAGYVYRIKFDSTVQAERVARLRAEIRRERDAIAKLRAEWARLDSPDRIEQLARRHLRLKPEDATQFDDLDRLPERPQLPSEPDSGDPIGAMIDNLEDLDTLTGTIAAPATRPAAPAPRASPESAADR